LDSLVKLLRSQNQMTQRAVCLAIANFSVTDAVRPAIVSSGALAELIPFVTSSDTQLQFQSLRAVSELCMSEATRVHVYGSGITPQLVHMMGTEEGLCERGVAFLLTMDVSLSVLSVLS